jgi:hypothetical protein
MHRVSYYVVRVACLVLIAAAGSKVSSAEENAGPIGYWKLQGDCKDSSGFGNHAINHGVDLSAAGGARFQGIDQFIEVPSSDELKLGKQDLSVSVWVHTEAVLTDVLGDLLSKYDPATRTGVTLSIMNYAGVTTAQSNYRHLSFGIDAGHEDKDWTDCGRPGNSKFALALAVYEGHLYCGTYEDEENEIGHVYRYDGGTNWTDCGLPNKSNGVGSLAVFQGKLYAGTIRYNGNGSLREKSVNWEPGGEIYRYEGGDKWVACGRLGESDAVGALAVFDGKLYASTLYRDGKGLYCYEGGDRWTYCGNPGRRTQPLTVFNGSLYAGSPDHGYFLRYDGGTNWTDLGQAAKETSQVYCFIAYEGKLYHGNWPTASVFSYDVANNIWSSVGRLGREQEVMAISVYNGKMYAGTLPLGKVYRFDGQDKWTFTGRLDNTPNVPYRRVWSMAVYDGKLFAGTLPAGRVYSFEAGKCATYDRELAPGWRHITAVKKGGELKLYVDGKCVDTSTTFDPEKFDLSNAVPLKIGFGQHDYFNGRMRDLRLYSRALDEAEIVEQVDQGK